MKHIERIVAISKRAFETDIEVGGAIGDYPPEYDSAIWHEQMLNEGHLFQAEVDGELIGGAVLFLSKNKESLYVGWKQANRNTCDACVLCLGIELRYTQKELYEMVLAVADGSLEYEDMLKWILEHQA